MDTQGRSKLTQGRTQRRESAVTTGPLKQESGRVDLPGRCGEKEPGMCGILDSDCY